MIQIRNVEECIINKKINRLTVENILNNKREFSHINKNSGLREEK